MEWLVIVVAVIASVMTGIILYRMDKQNNKKPTSKKSERE